jgi:hypothetical protein
MFLQMHQLTYQLGVATFLLCTFYLFQLHQLAPQTVVPHLRHYKFVKCISQGHARRRRKKHKCIADSSKSYQFRSIPEGSVLGILGYHTLQSKIFGWRELALG